VAQGFLPREDGSYEEFPENKTELMSDLLETAPDRTVIWCRFTHDIEKLYDLLGRDARCIRYYGGNKSSRPADKARWLSDQSIQYFIGNAQAGGTGLDWLIRNGPVSTVIYYSNSFSSIDRWQSEDRVYRFGTQGTVNIYDLITRGTLDRRQVNNLKRKRSVSDMSMQELKEIVAEL
jgi:SNF2 family DNA or RNA helicase